MRLQGKCVGDCSKCELLGNGDVEMVPCILDQMFQRMQRFEEMIRSIAQKIEEKKDVCLLERDEPEILNENKPSDNG